MPKTYDVVVIGSGPGGYVAAIRLAQLGKSVCVVERLPERLGGVCLNEGCIPTKALINSAQFFESSKDAAKAGVELTAKQPDMSTLISCALNTSGQLRAGIQFLFTKNKVDLIIGTASFAGDSSILVNGTSGEIELSAKNFIIATGSRPKVLAGLEPDNKQIITSEGIFKLERTPKSLLVIGGGAIGIEFGALFAGLGCQVTIVEVTEQLLPLEDIEVVQEVTKYLKKKGITVLTKAQVAGLKIESATCVAEIETLDSKQSKEFEYVLLCTGRTPNSDNLRIEKIGLGVEKGFIKVNEQMQTTKPHIYAVGDCINTPMLAHVASAEGIVAAESIAGHKLPALDYNGIPSVVYSPFQVARVGITEKASRQQCLDVAVSKHFFKSCGKAVLLHKDEGFIKIIAEKKTGHLVGVHIAGYQASELIHEFVLAKQNNVRVQDIARTIHAHPTLSEIAQDAARAVFDKAIHG
jgi:dihydrolipoamide dehydrogenase